MTQTTSAQLVFDDVHKVYEVPSGGVRALRGVSLSIPPADFVALWGPSGCGKSTLLHLAGGMDRPSQGRVLLAGRSLDGLRRDELAVLRRREIGFVFQAFHLLPTLTVSENVALPLTLDGKHPARSRDRVMELLEYVGLSHRASNYPAQLSGGEMQRVAVARAVIAQPRLVIADEPTGSLDSENGRRILDLLVDMNRRRHLTILLATHSTEAAAAARRVFRLRDGQIEGVEEHEPPASV